MDCDDIGSHNLISTMRDNFRISAQISCDGAIRGAFQFFRFKLGIWIHMKYLNTDKVGGKSI